MGTIDRKVGIFGWFLYGATVVVTAFLWVVFISALNYDLPISGPFVAALVISTVNTLAHLVAFPRFSLRHWYRHRTDTIAYEEGIKAYRALEVAPFDDQRAELEDHVRHVRTTICILNQWDPTTEADTGGQADRAILTYWQKRYPKDFALRDPQS